MKYTAPIILAFLFYAFSVHSCAVCYGAQDSLQAKGYNMGLLFLLGIVLLMQVSFFGFFMHLRKRARLFKGTL